MKLRALLQEIGVNCPIDFDLEVSGIATDSRKVRVNNLFVCIDGFHCNGADFLPQAIEKGAIAALTENCKFATRGCEIPLFYTENARKAAARLYAAWFGHPERETATVAVTGTNGKTTVTTILRQLLETKEHPVGLIGTVGAFCGDVRLDVRTDNPLANMTTPDPPELYKAFRDIKSLGASCVVMAVSSHALALSKVEPIQPKISVFTNLSPEHLDFHASPDEYADAKANLFRNAERSVINKDSLYWEKIRDAAGGKIVTCSELDPRADYFADEISTSEDGSVSYTLHCDENAFRIQTTLAGSFQVMNTMEAIAAAVEMGLSVTETVARIRTVKGAAGRMEPVDLGQAPFRVLIDYAHTPDALEKLLKSVKGAKRIVLLFGCGGDRDREKRPVMGRIAEENADFVIVTSDNPRSEKSEEILKQIESGMEKTNHVVINCRKKAIEYAIQTAQEGNLILLAGKGHETYELRGGRKYPFDEISIVREAYRKKAEPKSKEGQM